MSEKRCIATQIVEAKASGEYLRVWRLAVDGQPRYPIGDKATQLRIQKIDRVPYDTALKLDKGVILSIQSINHINDTYDMIFFYQMQNYQNILI